MKNIKRVKAPNSRCNYLTAYKEYRVLSIDPPKGFEIVNDNGDMIYCITEDDCHINGKNWIIVE